MVEEYCACVISRGDRGWLKVDVCEPCKADMATHHELCPYHNHVAANCQCKLIEAAIASVRIPGRVAVLVDEAYAKGVLTGRTEAALDIDPGLFREHQQHGYVCTCGADLNDMSVHLADVVNGVILNGPAGV